MSLCTRMFNRIERAYTALQRQMAALERLASRAATSEQQLRTTSELHATEIARLRRQHAAELERCGEHAKEEVHRRVRMC